MKFNWGHGLTIVITAFVLLMGFMAYNVMQIQFDLVEEDYYARELAHQDHINSVQNAKETGALPEMVITESSALFSFDAVYAGSTGELYFYNPVEKENDRRVLFTLEENTDVAVDLQQLPATFYHVKITWKQEGRSFYHETELHK
ncbi:MAG: hypothetical protein RL226_446 [Bacteroidota bacterium]|jgi:hypothetical protein